MKLFNDPTEVLEKSKGLWKTFFNKNKINMKKVFNEVKENSKDFNIFDDLPE